MATEKQIAANRANSKKSDYNGIPYQAPARPTPNGSVFSNEEVLDAAHRLTTFKVAKKALRSHPLKVQFAAAAPVSSPEVKNWPEPEAA